MTQYEYGVGMLGDVPEIDGPHRAGMSLEEAREWIKDAQEFGATPGAFFLVRRPIGRWQRFDNIIDTAPVVEVKKVGQEG